ncbi:MAG: hypothetical protein ABI629_13785 [bacterium]
MPSDSASASSAAPARAQRQRLSRCPSPTPANSGSVTNASANANGRWWRCDSRACGAAAGAPAWLGGANSGSNHSAGETCSASMIAWRISGGAAPSFQCTHHGPLTVPSQPDTGSSSSRAKQDVGSVFRQSRTVAP